MSHIVRLVSRVTPRSLMFFTNWTGVPATSTENDVRLLHDWGCPPSRAVTSFLGSDSDRAIQSCVSSVTCYTAINLAIIVSLGFSSSSSTAVDVIVAVPGRPIYPVDGRPIRVLAVNVRSQAVIACGFADVCTTASFVITIPIKRHRDPSRLRRVKASRRTTGD